jgi:hypothetical protein
MSSSAHKTRLKSILGSKWVTIASAALALLGTLAGLRFSVRYKVQKPDAEFVVLDASTRSPIAGAKVAASEPNGTESVIGSTDNLGVSVLEFARSSRSRTKKLTVTAVGYSPYRGSLNAPPNSGVNVFLLRRLASILPQEVCHFHGDANQGGAAYNHDDSCIIPNADLLDAGYQQNDFNCCGGGATSPTTPRDIPPGLELRVTGGHYWSVANPRLVRDQFSLHTYCGPEPWPGPGCNVDVVVRAHYLAAPN